ncbi:MAG: MarR family transcriptional regulator [Candidatus Altiarchaeota archaeon]|nr:MarR family transcriptional regulator [Candidatus Altiarchaeota archaeon]
MQNKSVGILITSISLLIGLIIYLFNNALAEIVSVSCSHGTSCTMWDTISFQTNTSLAIMIFVLGFGLYLTFFSNKKTETKNYSAMLKRLRPDEKRVLEEVINSKGAIFQSEIVEKSGMSKVKITRILDRLEGQGIIERRRRGMSNMIVLKEKEVKLVSNNAP